VDASRLSLILADFANERQLGQQRFALIVLDQAGWHRAKDLIIPEGVLLLFLPAYSPELQPVERIWPLVDAPMANGIVHDEDASWQRLDQHCAYLRSRPDLIRRYTDFHWWPATLTAST
jgi:transposase